MSVKHCLNSIDGGLFFSMPWANHHHRPSSSLPSLWSCGKSTILLPVRTISSSGDNGRPSRTKGDGNATNGRVNHWQYQSSSFLTISGHAAKIGRSCLPQQPQLSLAMVWLLLCATTTTTLLLLLLVSLFALLSWRSALWMCPLGKIVAQ